MISQVIYNDRMSVVCREDNAIEVSRHYDSDTSCMFRILKEDRGQGSFYTLRIQDDSRAGIRGFTPTELNNITTEYFGMQVPVDAEATKIPGEIFKNNLEAFKRGGATLCNEDLYYRYDLLEMFKIIRSVMVERNPANGYDEVSGVLTFIKDSRFVLSIKGVDKLCRTVRTSRFTVYFDGEYIYSPYNDMKPEDPYLFVLNLIESNGSITIRENFSVMPHKFTRFIPDCGWTYLTGIMTPGAYKNMQDKIEAAANGNTMLLSNPDFQKYICKKYIEFSE